MANASPQRTLGIGRYTPFWFLLPAVFALAAIGLYPTIFAGRDVAAAL